MDNITEEFERELKVKLGKYGQFPRYELVSMGLISPFTMSYKPKTKWNVKIHTATEQILYQS